MIIKLTNKAIGTRSYLYGAVTIQENATLIVDRGWNVLLAGDLQLISDLINNQVRFNDGVNDYAGFEAVDILKNLLQFMTNPLATSPLYYSAPVGFNHTQTVNSGVTLWGMRNSDVTQKVIMIEQFELRACYFGNTPIVPSTGKYEICRFSADNPIGSAVQPVKANNIAQASAISAIAQADDGISMGNAVFESAFATIIVPTIAAIMIPYERKGFVFKLAPGEGLAIKTMTSCPAQMGICGEIIWSER